MVIQVTIDEVDYGLDFGMNAVEAMQLRQVARMQSNDPTGHGQGLTDMFYCAHNNFNDCQEPFSLPRITYKKASEIIEFLLYSGDLETQKRIVEAFTNCRANQHIQEQLGELGNKKKVAKKKQA